jgi:formylglycine-generating enzyme required for sulfatase activity
MKNLLAILSRPLVWGLLAILGVGIGIGVTMALLSADDNTGMVWVEGGEFWMGVDDSRFPDAWPIHKVRVDGFWIDTTEVTNGQWKKFVDATGYKTIAERTPSRKQFPGVAPEELVPFSGVFHPPPGLSEVECEECLRSGECDRWWKRVPGANWMHPGGPDTEILGDDYPVVHIAYDDALAYCEWAKKRLPTEAEWEYAARGGLDRKPYYWGDEKRPGGKWMANTWQGPFPTKDTGEDGFAGVAPVKSFPPNAFGLYDMSGNVWEWCSDWYRPDYYRHSEYDNPKGPEYSIDPHGSNDPVRVQRGGSYLCADSYCVRYMAGARHQGAIDTGLSHTGFRCVRSR